jgi:hypothetical protein
MSTRPSDALSQALDSSTKQVAKSLKKAQLPTALSVIRYLCALFAVICIGGLLKGLAHSGGLTLDTAYRNAPGVFWAGGMCLVIWAVLTLVKKRKERTVLESDETVHDIKTLQDSIHAVETDLGIPSYAATADILTFFYKTKGDRIKLRTPGLQTAPYLTSAFSVFSDGENLCLANNEGKYAIPLTNITALRTVKKRTLLVNWSKTEPHNKGYYKQFKLARDRYGRILCKTHSILEFHSGGQQWALYIPNYELPIFEGLIGKKAQ